MVWRFILVARSVHSSASDLTKTFSLGSWTGCEAIIRPGESNLTLSDRSPRSPRFVRHTNSCGSIRNRSKARSRASNTICPSMRANGAPKQKCAAYPNARCRLSCRVISKRSGSGNRSGSRFAAAITAITACRLRISLPPSSRSEGAKRAVC